MKILICLLLLVSSSLAFASDAVMTGTNAQNIGGTKTFNGKLQSAPLTQVVLGGTTTLSWGLTSSAYDNANVWVGGTASSCYSMDGWDTRHTLVVRSSGLQGAAIVGWSQSGSPAGIFVQQHSYTSPVIQAIRDYNPLTDGTGTATSPVIDAHCSDETPDTVPVAQFMRCGVTGDNGVIFFPTGAYVSRGNGNVPPNPERGMTFCGVIPSLSGSAHFYGWLPTTGTAGAWHQLDK